MNRHEIAGLIVLIGLEAVFFAIRAGYFDEPPARHVTQQEVFKTPPELIPATQD